MSSPLEGSLLLPTLPPPISWWPPAPGWLALAALLVVLLILAPLAILLNRRRQRRRLKAQRILWEIPDGLSDHDWLAALNTQIKRHLKSRGEISATRLYGASWVEYLCQHYPRPRADLLAPLGGSLYQADVQLSSADRRILQRELLRWIRHNHV
ncbi:hypothetical protein GCM10007421_23890 [Halopseudomonas oceani]|uniref:DUF4381 domain-containing protein n=1 Tax=Halopseudomonas oceani TaxID=1708783 RepID=A0A2P4EUG4_9GAMM|nr:DUF4381 family protein [Halopseudomonas oceani]POB03120.1 hypothetical protein C1949_10500 [Halopseudomonas oceani]GGE48876.1 hypothetical protein GCM10007421_23890 [Halopseudomonas oceani]